jgi:hypothetical protein
MQVDGTTVRWTDHRGVERVFTATNIPKNLSIAQAEAWANDWLDGQVEGYVMRVHIFSLNPLSINVCCADVEEKIPALWWER